MVTRESVVCPNVRDLFTAGGKNDYVIGKNVYQKVPRIFLNLFDNVENIVEMLMQTSSLELSECWAIHTNDKTKLLDWINLVAQNAYKISDAKHLNIKEMLEKSLIK